MDRRSFRLGLALGAAAGVVVVAVLIALRVAGPGWPDDAIHVPRDAPTLKQALVGAKPGATIVLHPRGEPYRGPVTIAVAGITVAAAGTVRVEGTGGRPAITVEADRTVLQGLEIHAEAIGIRVAASQCIVERVAVLDAPIGILLDGARNATLRDLELRGGTIGLELTAVGGSTISQLEIRDSADVGLRVTASWENQIEETRIADVPVGISVDPGSERNTLRRCRIDRTSIAAVQLRGATETRVIASTLRDGRVGILVDRATGCEIAECEIERMLAVGVWLQQASANTVTENTIRRCRDAGILLSQASENAIRSNHVERCEAAGVRLDGSDRNLVLGNRLGDSPLGIELQRSTNARVMRNAIAAEATGRGISIVAGGDHQLLDNRVNGGALGILVRRSEGNTVLRNTLDEQTTAGIVVDDGSDANSILENRIIVGQTGIVAAGATRIDLLGNEVRGHDTGILLNGAGPGVRIEGNTIADNRVGLRQTDDEAVAELDRPGRDAETGPAIVAHNGFLGNEQLDVMNDSAVPLYAVGNWWNGDDEPDPSAAAVAGNVLLEGSAWKATLAVGTQADTVQELLGRILQIALSDAGFRVIDLIGIGDWETVGDALRSRDVDMVWWRTTPGEAEPPPGGDEIAALPIPVERRWTVVVPETTAKQLEAKTLSALFAWAEGVERTIRYAVIPSFGEPERRAFETAYGLRPAAIAVERASSMAGAETLLKLGSVDLAVVDSLTQTLTASGYVELEDDRGAFSVSRIVAAAYVDTLERYPEIGDVLEELSEAVTSSLVHQLISRVRLLQRRPEAVAREALLELGILAE